MIWNDVDIEMAEAIQASDHRATLLSGDGMSEEDMRECERCATVWLDAGYYDGGFDAVIHTLEDNPKRRPTDEQFDEMQWNSWHASEEGKRQ